VFGGVAMGVGAFVGVLVGDFVGVFVGALVGTFVCALVGTTTGTGTGIGTDIGTVTVVANNTSIPEIMGFCKDGTNWIVKFPSVTRIGVGTVYRYTARYPTIWTISKSSKVQTFSI
jgi:hypothetical protein